MTLLAWHFVCDDGKTQHQVNGKRRIIHPGLTLQCDPNWLEMCQYGFHGSENPLDALSYAPGSIVSRVELGGRLIVRGDKAVASQRTVLWCADATAVLHEFACLCAEDALGFASNPDPRSIAAVSAKRQWLRGKIDDGQLAAARAAIWAAARDAARAAVWAAVWAAYSDLLFSMLMGLAPEGYHED